MSLVAFDDLLSVEISDWEDMASAYRSLVSSQSGLIIPVSGPGEIGVLLRMAALRGYLSATVADSAVGALVHE